MPSQTPSPTQDRPLEVEAAVPQLTNPGEFRVCLLGASLEADNRGVAALVTGAITGLRSAFPLGLVTLVDYSKKPRRSRVRVGLEDIQIELVNMRFSKNLFLSNNIAILLILAIVYRIVTLQPVRRRLVARSRVIRCLVEADTIGSIAGGDSFSDIYGFGRLLYVALPQILVLLLGKPLVLLPQTIGPFHGRTARLVARQILTRARLVCSRDEASLIDIASLHRGAPAEPRVCADMAFIMEPVAPAEPVLARLKSLKSSKPLVGVNVSGLLLMGGYSRANMFKLKVNYRELVERIIIHFVNQNAEVLLIPHVFGSDPESDPPACRCVHQDLDPMLARSVHVLDGDFSAAEVKYAIGLCDFFLGSRMHACIAALSQFVPAIGLAYSRKFEGVFRTVGVGSLALNIHTELSVDSVLSKVQAAYADREKLRAGLREMVPVAKKCIFQFFAEIGR